MFNTHVRPSRDLRTHYADVIRDLKEHNHVLITNQGRGEAVLIGIDDFAAYEEFLHKRYVIEALEKAKSEASDPKTKWQTEKEFFQEIQEML